MKRLHVHVSVDNLADSIKFYSGMFGTDPSVEKMDYAKWMLEDPRMNFAISKRGAETGLNHLGIQVESAEELAQMQTRLHALEPAVELEADTACCYAKSDKYWVTDPSGIAWETFHTLDSIPVFGEPNKTAAEACCAPAIKSEVKVSTASSCCMPNKADKKSACC